MKRFPVSLLLACGFFAMLCAPAMTATPSQRPNIIIILGDDMGYSDIGCFGGGIQTPNLDALAAGGVRFTQFYNTARCCPTRASLLTGLYPHQAGIGHMMDDRGFDGYRGILNDRCVTIAEALRPAGYRTYMTGKWHVTRNNGPQSDQGCWPLQRGFDKFYGTITGAGSYYDPTTLCRQNTFITPDNDNDYQPASYYYTDAISDNAIQFLSEHRAESPEQPFFLYLAYTAAHWPLHALEEDIAKYHGAFDAGYEAVRAARFERMKKLGLLSENAELSLGAGDWNRVEDKAWEARCMEVYAAQVDRMDQGIGRVIEELRLSGQLDNTAIFFLQDNGGCAEEMGRSQNRPDPGNLKPMAPDQLQPQIWPPMQTRDGRWVRTGPGVMPGPADTYVAYGRNWANVSNTPFREYKHWTHEGGISTPLIAYWPAGISEERSGALEPQPGHLIDLMATCVDLAGASYPTIVDGKKIQPMEGVSLRPAFEGESLARKNPLYWEHEGNRAVREGKWKLVGKENQPWELYDISVDRSELHDLASAQPDVVNSLAAKWEAYAARANVLPLGAWRKSISKGNEGLSRQSRFELREKETLDRKHAPAIAGRPLKVEATVNAGERSRGVIVAQGGSAFGYALFLDETSRPVFAKRDGGKLSVVRGPTTMGGKHRIGGSIAHDGEMILSVDGTTIGRKKGPGPISMMPADGLQVGSDAGGAVGNYQTPNPFSGTIESVIVELEAAD